MGVLISLPSALRQQRGNLVRVVRNHNRPVPERGSNRRAVGRFQCARVISDRCSPDPSTRCRSARPRHPRPRAITPAAVSLRIPASVAADAGSQPIPHSPMIAFASAISCSVTFSTTPDGWSNLVQRLRPGHRVADLDRRRQRLRMARPRGSRLCRPRLHQVVERRRTSRPESRPGAASCG